MCSSHSKIYKTSKTEKQNFYKNNASLLSKEKKVKNTIAASFSKLCPQKLYQCEILLQKSKFFAKLRSNYSKKFWKKDNNSATWWAISTKSFYTSIYVTVQQDIKLLEILFINSWFKYAPKSHSICTEENEENKKKNAFTF